MGGLGPPEFFGDFCFIKSVRSLRTWEWVPPRVARDATRDRGDTVVVVVKVSVWFATSRAGGLGSWGAMGIGDTTAVPAVYRAIFGLPRVLTTAAFPPSSAMADLGSSAVGSQGDAVGAVTAVYRR